jgi:hypothetical protein
VLAVVDIKVGSGDREEVVLDLGLSELSKAALESEV